MANTLPSLPGLNECDLKAIEAIAEAADDRFSKTIRVLLKEIRRLQEFGEHLKLELSTAMNANSTRNQKRKMR
jgi:hypothetical protein